MNFFSDFLSGMLFNEPRKMRDFPKVYHGDLFGFEEDLERYTAIKSIPAVVSTIRTVTVFVSGLRDVLSQGGRFRASECPYHSLPYNIHACNHD